MLKTIFNSGNLIRTVFLAVFLMHSQAGHAVIMPATASSETNEASIFGFGSQKLDGFGVNSQTGPQSSLKTVIGADVFGAPFSSSQATSNNTSASWGFATTQLKYSWSIQGGSPESTDPVLVHISTKGSISSQYTHISNPANPQPPNDTQAQASVGFDTYTASGLTSSSYAVYHSPWYTIQGYPQTLANTTFDADSGRTTSTYADSFNVVFDLWVTPNMDNTIWMHTFVGYAANNFYPLPLAWNPKAAIEDAYSVYAFVDPTITIDSQFVDDYTLEVSYIPPVSVPEPSTLFLLVLGMIGLGATRVRKTV